VLDDVGLRDAFLGIARLALVFGLFLLQSLSVSHDALRHKNDRAEVIVGYAKLAVKAM
jgi:hypothetical protein